MEERTLTAREVEWLLDKLCVDCGFCSAPPERLKLQREPPTGVTTSGFGNVGAHIPVNFS